ncbi:unnamed protein product [Sphacelaria rigidula]
MMWSKQAVLWGGGRKPRAYPHIATLARKYLAVQGSSAASELVFSVGGPVLTKARNRLSGDRVEEIVVLHGSMKHDLW